MQLHTLKCSLGIVAITLLLLLTTTLPALAGGSDPYWGRGAPVARCNGSYGDAFPTECIPLYVTDPNNRKLWPPSWPLTVWFQLVDQGNHKGDWEWYLHVKLVDQTTSQIVDEYTYEKSYNNQEMNKMRFLWVDGILESNHDLWLFIAFTWTWENEPVRATSLSMYFTTGWEGLDPQKNVDAFDEWAIIINDIDGNRVATWPSVTPTVDSPKTYTSPLLPIRHWADGNIVAVYLGPGEASVKYRLYSLELGQDQFQCYNVPPGTTVENDVASLFVDVPPGANNVKITATVTIYNNYGCWGWVAEDSKDIYVTVLIS